MPSRAKMTMKRKSSSKRLAMERILFSSEATRFLSEDQYLVDHKNTGHLLELMAATSPGSFMMITAWWTTGTFSLFLEFLAVTIPLSPNT